MEKDYRAVADFLPLKGTPPPLCFIKSNTREPEPVRMLDDFVIFHPGSRWIKKRWPLENWIQLGQALLEHTRTIIVSCGPAADESELAAKLVSALDPKQVLNSDGRWSWRELAGCLYRARVYIGRDTAATHLAAACGCPIVALYAYTRVDQWKPWMSPCHLFHPIQWLESWEEVIKYTPREIMETHTPNIVGAAVNQIMRSPTASDEERRS